MSRGARFLTPAVALVALLVRLLPALVTNGLRQPGDQDGGAYFGAAQHLLAGDLPYRDVLFLHPPGIAVMLAPFAGLSFLIQDSTAFAVVRVVFMLVGAANAALVAVLLRRYGTAAALVGGLAYATWAAVAATETTAMLEPVLNLLLLLAFLAWRRPFAVGALLGLAVAVKIWAVADVVVLAAALWAQRGRRPALLALGGAAAAAAVVIGPFVAAAPGAAWRAIVADQAGRARDGGSLGARLTYFLPGTRFTPLTGGGLVLGAAAGALLALAVVAALVVARRRPEPLTWTVLLAVHLALLAASPSFYYHYVTYAAAPLCLVLGWAAGALLRRVRFGVLVAVAALAVLGVTAATTRQLRHTREPALIAFATQHRCVWADTWQLLVSNDAAANEVDAGCATWLDRYAHGIVAAAGRPADNATLATLPDYQRALRRQYDASDALMMSGGARSSWSTATRTWVRARFRWAGRVGGYVLFERR